MVEKGKNKKKGELAMRSDFDNSASIKKENIKNYIGNFSKEYFNLAKRKNSKIDLKILKRTLDSLGGSGPFSVFLFLSIYSIAAKFYFFYFLANWYNFWREENSKKKI